MDKLHSTELKIIGRNIAKFMKRRGVFPHKTPPQKTSFRNMNQLRMIKVRNVKISASSGGTETVIRNRCSYQVPAVVGTNASTNENHKFYNSEVLAISRGGGKCTTKFGYLCECFFHRRPGKTPSVK